MAELSCFKYPLEFDPVNGGFKMSQNDAVKRDNIASLIQTVVSERIMNYNYGIPFYLFEVIDNMSIITQKIDESIKKYIPDIFSKSEYTFNQSGELLITINWKYFSNQSIVNEPIFIKSDNNLSFFEFIS